MVSQTLWPFHHPCMIWDIPGITEGLPVCCCSFVAIYLISQHFECRAPTSFTELLRYFMCLGRLDRLQIYLEASFLLSSSLGTQKNTEQISLDAPDFIQWPTCFLVSNSSPAWAFSIHCFGFLSLRHDYFPFDNLDGFSDLQYRAILLHRALKPLAQWHLPVLTFATLKRSPAAYETGRHSKCDIASISHPCVHLPWPPQHKVCLACQSFSVFSLPMRLSCPSTTVMEIYWLNHVIISKVHLNPLLWVHQAQSFGYTCTHFLTLVFPAHAPLRIALSLNPHFLFINLNELKKTSVLI